MRKYRIKIYETQYGVVEIEAENANEALDKFEENFIDYFDGTKYTHFCDRDYDFLGEVKE